VKQDEPYALQTSMQLLCVKTIDFNLKKHTALIHNNQQVQFWTSNIGNAYIQV